MIDQQYAPPVFDPILSAKFLTQLREAMPEANVDDYIAALNEFESMARIWQTINHWLTGVVVPVPNPDHDSWAFAYVDPNFLEHDYGPSDKRRYTSYDDPDEPENHTSSQTSADVSEAKARLRAMLEDPDDDETAG